MGFFEKIVGDGFFQKVDIMFGTELNIMSLYPPHPHPLPSWGEGRVIEGSKAFLA